MQTPCCALCIAHCQGLRDQCAGVSVQSPTTRSVGVAHCALHTVEVALPTPNELTRRPTFDPSVPDSRRLSRRDHPLDGTETDEHVQPLVVAGRGPAMRHRRDRLGGRRDGTGVEHHWNLLSELPAPRVRRGRATECRGRHPVLVNGTSSDVRTVGCGTERRETRSGWIAVHGRHYLRQRRAMPAAGRFERTAADAIEAGD